MNKKLIIVIVVVLVIAIIGIIGAFLLNNSKTTNNNIIDNITSDDSNKDDTSISPNGKTLVVYYSATGSTKKIAEEISSNLNAQLFEITPEDKYTSDDLDWTDDKSRVSKEHDDESLRNVKLTTTKVDNWEDYDTVLIGYPIW